MIGGHIVGRYGSCTEATLLPVVGHRLFGDDTCLHELGHAIHFLAMGPAMRERVLERYRSAVAAGLWKDTYAATDEREFFAEMTKYYFRKQGNRVAFYDRTPSRARAWLCANDPETCALVGDLYSGATSPGEKRFEPLALRSASIEPTLASGEGSTHSHVLVRNDTARTVRAVWVDFHGERRPLGEEIVAPPGGYIDLYTFATHAWVLADENGAALCAFVAPNADAEAVLAMPCR
jgi:hypothetical protein